VDRRRGIQRGHRGGEDAVDKAAPAGMNSPDTAPIRPRSIRAPARNQRRRPSAATPSPRSRGRHRPASRRAHRGSAPPRLAHPRRAPTCHGPESPYARRSGRSPGSRTDRVGFHAPRCRGRLFHGPGCTRRTDRCSRRRDGS
jgi:hypothetical protein